MSLPLPAVADHLNRRRINVLVAAVVFVVAAYELAEYVIAGDMTGLLYVALVAAAVVSCVAIVKDWRRGVYALVTWVLFEDFVRKYLGNNMAIYFGKDVLALVLYASFFRARRVQGLEHFRIPFRIPLLMFFWFGLLQVFNPASTSIFYGILGMKVYFLYVPLMYAGYALIRSDEDLRRFFSFACLLIIVVAGLGLAQSIIGPTFLNPPKLQEDISRLATTYRVAPSSGAAAYRPTSVFVSAGRFQDFLILSWLFSLGYGGYLLLRRQRGQILAFATAGLVAAASLMSASRGVFMWNGGIALILVAGFLWGARGRQRETFRIIRAIQGVALFAGVGIMLLLTIFPEEWGSRMAIYSETLLPSSPTSELVRRTQIYPLQQLGYAFDHPRWPYGYGIGTCTLGGQYVIRIMHAQPMGIGVESGFGNLIVELGIVGLVLWIVLGFSIAVSAWKVVKELRGTPWFPFCFAIYLYAVLLFFPMTYTSFTAYQDFVLNAFLWLQLGILYRLRHFAYEISSAETVEGRN